MQSSTSHLNQPISASYLPTKTIVSLEVLAGLATAALYPFGISNKSKKTMRSSSLRTVVFIHGYLSNPSCFKPMSLYLKTKGIKSQLFFNYSSKNGVETAAVELKKFLEKNVRGGQVDLVCHSLGGLVAKVYLDQLGGHRKIKTCITLGTPYKGTYNAYWLWSKVGADLRPESLFLKKMWHYSEKSKKVRFVSIAATSDNIVLPREYALNSNEEHHVLSNIGHLGLLFSKRAVEIVYSSICDSEVKYNSL